MKGAETPPSVLQQSFIGDNMSDFMKKYKKAVEKDKARNAKLLPDPTYYLHTGSYSLNRLMSGKFEGGAPQGRIVSFGGHSSSGKSLVGASILAHNLKNGGIGIVIDSEGAIDNRFLAGVGIDVTDEDTMSRFLREGTSEITHCSRIVNNFIRDYAESGDDTRVVIFVDSLDNLFTDSETKDINTVGDLGGDQGQRAKQLKRMLLSWTHSISTLNITIICSKQVYVEQDKFKAYEEPWVFTESLKYPCSQIIVVEKLQFKDKATKEHKGFTLKAKSYKNRHTKEKQVAKIEVPFKDGLDPYAGLLEIAEQLGVVIKNNAWYSFANDNADMPKFQRKTAENDPDTMEAILTLCCKANDEELVLEPNLDEYLSELDKPSEETQESGKARRQRKANEALEDSDDDSE